MIPALDGFRGLAVLLVVFTHLHLLGVGWIGVQIFFVLSGYLITRLLLRDAEAQPLGLYLRHFYIRRALRIFPAFYLYLCGLTLCVALFRACSPIAHELPFIATYTSNFYMASSLEPIYSRANWTIAHLWSLCVEEHFYLLWPGLVYWLGRKHTQTLTIVLIALGPLLRLTIHARWPELHWENLSQDAARVVYVLTPSHFDAFAAGALACMLPRREMGGKSLLFFALAVLCIYAEGAMTNSVGIFPSANTESMFTLGFPIYMRDGYQYAWGYTAINLLSAQLILMTVEQPLVNRFFSMRWLRYTGKISYGMYILHMALILIMVTLCEWAGVPLERTWQRLLVAPLLLATLYILASLSFHFYEQSFLRLKERFQSPLKRLAPDEVSANAC